MKKEICFIIEKDELYMDQILIDCDGIPFFYVCKGRSERYLVLRNGYEKESYIIEKIDNADLINMIRGRVSMRETMQKPSIFWSVVTAENIELDNVQQQSIEDIPLEDLPYENTYYEILDDEVEEYLEILEAESEVGATELDGVEGYDKQIRFGGKLTLDDMLFETNFQRIWFNELEWERVYSWEETNEINETFKLSFEMDKLRNSGIPSAA